MAQVALTGLAVIVMCVMVIGLLKRSVEDE